MRILHTADWHLGRTLEGRSRLKEQEQFLDELHEIVRDEQIDLVLIAGDVYDSVNPPAAAEQLYYESLARLSDGGKRAVVVIGGNHDHPERLAAASPLTEMQNIYVWGYPAASAHQINIARTGETACLFPLAYPSESRLKTLLSVHGDEQQLRQAYSAKISELTRAAAQQFQSHTVNLIVSHLYVLGGVETDSERPIQVGGAYTVDTKALDGLADYVALGHLHRPQNVKADRLIRYSGSPLAYSFSEAGQAKSVTIIDVDPTREHRHEWREIPLTSGKPLVRWTATGGLAEVHQWLEEGRDAEAWIDLSLHISSALSMEKIQTLRRDCAGLIHIRPIYPEMEADEAAESRASQLPIDELFRRFYRRQTGGADPEPALTELFMDLLLEGASEDETKDEKGEVAE